MRPGRVVSPNRLFGRAWICFAAAIGVHVIDEDLTGFLVVYNPTVITLRERYPWFPMPAFEYEYWLGGLLIAVVVLFSLSRAAFRGARWLRILAVPLALLMMLNGLAHIAGTLFPFRAGPITFTPPMPGFYSAPLLIAASLFLLWRLRRAGELTSPR